ncbi:hypothetical protein B296_00031019, partial [Ensete ventricosum]
ADLPYHYWRCDLISDHVHDYFFAPHRLDSTPPIFVDPRTNPRFCSARSFSRSIPGHLGVKRGRETEAVGMGEDESAARGGHFGSAARGSRGVHYLAKCVLRGSAVLHAVQGHIRSPYSSDIVFGKVLALG